jgi:long-chain fatty acid transport protein
MAGGIDNKHNFSAEYIRTLNRNAATDSADAVVYNPAGVVKIEEGFFLNLSGQYAFKDYSNTIGGTEYESDKDDIVPGLFALFRKDKWAGYAAFTIPCGGGSVDYEDGMATTLRIAERVSNSINYMAGMNVYQVSTDQALEGESFYYGFTFGGAYEVNDWLSLSAGLRYIDANREFEGHATLNATAAGAAAGLTDITPEVKYKETDNGWGGIFGVNISPTDELNIGIRYETKTKLTLETEQKKDTLETTLPLITGQPTDGIVQDGAERDRDLPALLGLGVSYQLTPELRTEANFTLYFNDDANWDDDYITAGDETKKDNGYDIGLALEYAFNPKLRASLGYMYTETEIDADDMLYSAPELDAHTIAGGVAYEAMPGLNLNFGILKTFYQDEKTSSDVKLEKDVIIVALGVQYKFW